jgi:hypothetical protein
MTNPIRCTTLTLALLFAACTTSSKVLKDDLTTPGDLRAPALGAVTFRFDDWVNAEANDVKKARESEAEWAKAIGDAFAERVAGKFPGGGEPVKVDIAVIDLDPGSKAARFWVGYGAGTGMIVADVTVAGHGSFRISGKITGGWFGGSFLGILRKLGREIADHLAERAGR